MMPSALAEHSPTTAPFVALQSASQALARVRGNTEDDILDQLQRLVRPLLPPSRIHILLFLEGQSKLQAWNRYGDALPPSYFGTPAAQGIMGWLRETKESLLVGDFHRDWEQLPARPSYDNPEPPRAAIFVPLVIGDEALGALSVQSNDPDVYTADHLWQLKILANQAAAAIHADRLLRSEQWRGNQLQTLATVTRSVVSILNLDALLSHVVDIIQAAFGYYHVQVYVIEKGTNQVVFRASSGDETHALWLRTGKHVGIGQGGMIGWVAEYGETLVAPDVSIDPLYIPDDPRLLPNTRSEIAIALKLETDVLGVLDVQSDRQNAFGPDDLLILNALADAVALAVANAQLYARVQEDAWITVSLLEVAEATNRLTELPEVVETIARLTPLLTGVMSVAIWLQRERSGLQREEGGLYQPVAHWGIHEETVGLFLKHDLTAAGDPILSLLEAEQGARIVRQDKLDELLSPILAQSLQADALVFLPLLVRGELMGVMVVGVEEANGPLSERRIPLLKGIVDQAAAAIHNAQLIAAQREEAWVSTALLQVAQAMGRARDLPETLDVVARLTTALSGLDRCTIFMRHGQEEGFFPTISHSQRRNLPAFVSEERLHPTQVPLLERLVSDRTAIAVPDLRQSDLVPSTLAALLATKALIAMPLVASDAVVGAMLVDEVEAHQVYSRHLLDILSGIANQAAVAIERGRLQQAEIEQQRLVTELAVAHDIQRGFLPDSLPRVSGYEVAALWEPAREIGGDFYDFVALPQGRWGLVIADVADKGVPAALYMALSRTAMRMVAGRHPSPATVLQQVNTAILDTTYSDMFVTIYYAVLDPATHQVTYASAGHGLALHASDEGVQFLRGRGSALGILPTIRVDEGVTSLAPGDYLVLYTDGVTDAINAQIEDFGEERLIATVRSLQGASSQAMVDGIHAAVYAWEEGAAAFDDFTLVVARRLPEGQPGIQPGASASAATLQPG